MKECIVVTGATSMLGIALLETALQDGEIKKIYAVVRENTERLEIIPKNQKIEIIKCNLNRYKSLREKVKETVHVFYHLAWKLTGKQRNADIPGQAQNIGYALDAVHAAMELGCKKFIGVGSQAEYGDIPFVKMAPDTIVNPTEPYGIAKFCAGQLVRQEAKRLGMDCFWIRVFSVYGKYDRESTMISQTINSLLKGESPLFTPAENIWDFLERRDAGKALLAIGKKAKGNKIYCLGSGEGRPLREYIEIIGAIVNPGIKMRIGELSYPENKCRGICADISSLTEDTGWKPEISFEEGIASMII